MPPLKRAAGRCLDCRVDPKSRVAQNATEPPINFFLGQKSMRGEILFLKILILNETIYTASQQFLGK